MIKRRLKGKWNGFGIRFFSFSGLYLIITLFIVPPLAKLNGRVPLPWISKEGVGPHTIMTCLGNRHYVKPDLLEEMQNVSKQMQAIEPKCRITYLDANFPFLDEFPLWPHLSHDDGEKLDIAFIYQSTKSGELLTKGPTWFGYGFYEEPRSGEQNQPEQCAQAGHWQYSVLKYLSFQSGHSNYQFDQALNTRLIQTLSRRKQIKKIFIEPHLKTRLGLSNNSKVRYHGCHAVRHDDHIHLQL